MANHLSMALIDTIRTLHSRGWTQRGIARALNIHRGTVARYLDALDVEAKPANAPPGSGSSESEAKPANAPPGSEAASSPGQLALTQASLAASPDPSPPPLIAKRAPGCPSACLAYRDFIVEKLEQDLSAKRIYQDLRAERAYPGSYFSVRRFVGRLLEETPLPFRRMECRAGEEAQVDFGLGAPLLDAKGKRSRPYVLRVVLSHSRKGYSEVIDRQTTDEFIRCVENAFWAFGGVPRCLVLDNLRAAVKKADWFDPEITPKVRSFAEHYGVALMPTRAYTPRHKGKVERGVDYVQENALKGRTFSSRLEQNDYLRGWEETVADTRIHGTTRKQVGKQFLEVEKQTLLPLPAERFANFQEGRRMVHRDGYVEVERAYYSVPPEYLARRVWVRWDGRMVRIHNDRMEQVAVHTRQEAGAFSTHSSHIPERKISGVERGAAWLLAQIGKLGSQAVRWAQGVLENRAVEGPRVIQGLLALVGKYSASQIDQACGIALEQGEYRLEKVRVLASQSVTKEDPSPMTQEHPLIRPMVEYQQVLNQAEAKEN